MRPSRREFLIGSAGIGMASALPLESASATPAMLEEAIRDVIGEANLQTGKITLEVPPLVENGNTVPVTIIVDSPMSKADHVKAIHVFNEKNPQPHVISITLGPRAGKARIATRIKLADTQRIVGIAEMSDGSFWTGEANVIVTIAACVEDVK
ncbi:MAG TPA: SoxY-related AACIE arm protein [Stellaceae bacterium]|jgi:sulfur-oxidizing protein SoxY|nr:SoxY-related AACIE arm protein [Stellaceae bacterium]